jgi:hypothetical protein
VDASRPHDPGAAPPSSRLRGLRTVALVVPPLLVAGVLAVLLSRSSAFDERVRVEDDLRSRWGVAERREAVRADAERYLVRHGSDPEARWFAAEALGRAGALARAHEVVWGAPEVASDPRTPRRYATLLLDRLGERTASSWPRVLLVRAELDLPGAREALREEILRPEMTGGAFLLFFEGAHRGGSASRALVSEALRARAEAAPDGLRVRLAAAALVSGPRERADVPLLLSGLGDPEVRRDLLAWRQVVRALGAVRLDEATAALAAAEASARTPPERESLAVGLAIAEAPGWPERALERAREPGGTAPVDSALYANGLVSRATQGDASAHARMRDLWAARANPLVRIALGSAALLGDAPPQGLPAETWASDLRAEAEPTLRAFALAWDWRTRRVGAVEVAAAIGRWLSDPALESDSSGLHGPLGAVLEACRAFLRF